MTTTIANIANISGNQIKLLRAVIGSSKYDMIGLQWLVQTSRWKKKDGNVAHVTNSPVPVATPYIWL
jgi:hypothetical protein